MIEWVNEIERDVDNAVLGPGWMEDYEGNILEDFTKLIAAVRAAERSLERIRDCPCVGPEDYVRFVDAKTCETLTQIQSGEFEESDAT